MNRKHVARQTQRERNCSPSNGTERRTSARIARVGVSALIAGQLMMPSMSLAAETTDQNAVQANSTATVTTEEAAPAPTGSINAKDATETQSTPIQTSKEPAAAPEAQSTPKANSSEPDTPPRKAQQHRLHPRRASSLKQWQLPKRLPPLQRARCQLTPSKPAA